MESTERLPDRSVIDGLLDEKKTETRQKVEVWILDILGSEGPDRVTPAAKASAVSQITRLINRIVEDLLGSAWPHARKNGLVALRELTFMMDTDWAQCCAQKITNPILVCFSDEDSDVRYKACEAFINVAKVIRSGILEDMGAVFHGLCRLYTDVEQQIKEGAQSLDRLVRDIVVEQRHFDYSVLIPLIAARIHVLNPSVRQLVLGWIVLLYSMPQVDMIAFLPHYLEGLFGILASDNRDFRLKAQECLDGLLEEIRKSASERPERTQQAIAQAAATVARCCRAGGEQRSEAAPVRFNALKWLLESVNLQAKLQVELTMPGADGVSSRSLRRRPSEPVADAGAAALGLRQLIPELLPGALYCLDDGESTIQQDAIQANLRLREAMTILDGDQLPVEPIAHAVISAMFDVGGQERSKEVLLRCFSWAELLLDRCPAKVVQPEVRDRLLGAALKALLRQEDEVASTALRFAANLTAMGEQLGEEGEDLVGSMCHRLFRLMKEQPNLLARRGELIVRKICDGLVHQGVDVQRFFATAAKAINQEEDKAFARRLVQVLNRGLLTGPETKAFRAWLQLEVRRCEQKGELRPELQMVLMEAWMVCPVSSLALSFWLNEFEFAAGLATRLATAPRTDEIEAQLKDFVELLESPVFSELRLQMLGALQHRSALLRAMLQLGALLPKEKCIQGRLQVLETGVLLDRVTAKAKGTGPFRECCKQAQDLLERFDEVCERDHRWKDCIL